MAALPPEDSPVWNQMEDDIAEERWPVPSPFGWMGFWYRGPRNELHRRALYLRGMAVLGRKAEMRSHRSLRLARRIYFIAIGIYLLAQLIFDPFGHRSRPHPYWTDPGGLPFLVTMLATAALGMGFGIGQLWFERSARRYFRAHPGRAGSRSAA